MRGSERIFLGFVMLLMGMGIFFGRVCDAADGDGHIFWDCAHPPLVYIRDSPEFHDLRQGDESNCRRCTIRTDINSKEFIHTQCDFKFTHVLWHMYTHALTCSDTQQTDTTLTTHFHSNVILKVV